jgi:hypothetical protein
LSLADGFGQSCLQKILVGLLVAIKEQCVVIVGAKTAKDPSDIYMSEKERT